MTIEHLQKAIEVCNEGNVKFNTGITRSFLYEKKWYPLRAVINYAAFLAKEKSNLTTDQALVKLTNLQVWTKIKSVYFSNAFPVILSQIELIKEVNYLSKKIDALTS
ncbi:hypothetical protein [Emticicia sp. BO119]|uniref:hypothetical protein n=1 Tax=Emticicia sp. BO119 TaxID=2757768 RepID=UPI0015F094E1|nr:hypothetical protein [Emticicia sp. BO119]MBA4853808.1 hypothetical protein [Emticicia sp. BO119]